MGGFRTVDEDDDALWSAEESGENQLTMNSELMFEYEFVGYDAADGVFASPRPSYTLNEIQAREHRDGLMAQQRPNRGIEESVFEPDEQNVLERLRPGVLRAPEEDNPWAPKQARPGVTTKMNPARETVHTAFEDDSDDSDYAGDDRRGASLLPFSEEEQGAWAGAEWQKHGGAE